MMISLHILLLVSATLLVVTAAPGDKQNEVSPDDVKSHVNELIDQVPVDKLVDLICDCKVKETCDSAKVARDCSDLLRAGNKVSRVYDIYPLNAKGPVQVFCDMTTDGGGWTVFQRREDGLVDFYRDWANYKSGFGMPGGEFWLGNDNIYWITGQQNYELRVDLEDCYGRKKYALYGHFRITDEIGKYKLALGKYNTSGTAGDSLTYHNGRYFSTKDKDYDGYRSSCAASYRGGWWYGTSCISSSSNLNGRYVPRGTHATYVTWYRFTPGWQSMKRTEMKIRPIAIA